MKVLDICFELTLNHTEDFDLNSFTQFACVEIFCWCFNSLQTANQWHFPVLSDLDEEAVALNGFDDTAYHLTFSHFGLLQALRFFLAFKR